MMTSIHTSILKKYIFFIKGNRYYNNIANKYVYFVLIFISISAIILRFLFLTNKGGFSADQIGWAVDNYYGGLTKYYLYMRDTILNGEYETQPYVYLPGYGVFLAVLKITGFNSLVDIRIIQILIDSFAVFPLFYISRNIARSAPIALVSCGIYAICPWWASGSTYLLAESLLPALVILLLAAMVAIRKRAESALHWASFGLFAAILPFFRSEMMLLVIPLAVWALLVSPARRRVLSMFSVTAAFSAPLLAWSARNYAVHGHFMLTPPAKWYAAWSGLGQVPNSFGYFVGDARAIQLLSSKSIAYNSIQSEQYWKSEYITAWIDHPIHVIGTILYRFNLILTKVDINIWPSAQDIYVILICAAPVALLWLLWKRRWSDALLVALPAGYALCSLGIIYVELRYVRYASLSYVLAFPVFLVFTSNLSTFLQERCKPLKPVLSKSVLVTVCVAILVTCYLFEFSNLRLRGGAEAVAQRYDNDSFDELPWTRNLDDMEFIKAINDVKTTTTPSGLMLNASANSGTYLIMTPLSGKQGEVALVRYTVRLDSKALAIGVLSGDQKRWLTYNKLFGTRNGINNGEFTTAVEEGSYLVIAAAHGGGQMSALIKKLEWKLACRKDPVEPLLLLFNNERIRVGACDQN